MQILSVMATDKNIDLQNETLLIYLAAPSSVTNYDKLTATQFILTMLHNCIASITMK